jgi:hypothetical protein
MSDIDLSRSGQSEAKTRDFDADVPARDNTLTDAEREAVQWAIVAADLEKTETAGEFSAFVAERAATLRGLLARTQDDANRQ